MQLPKHQTHESTFEKKSQMSSPGFKVADSIPLLQESAIPNSKKPMTRLEELKEAATKLAKAKSKLKVELKTLRNKTQNRNRAYIKSIESWNKLNWWKRLFREIELPAEDFSVWNYSGLTSSKAFQKVLKCSRNAVQLLGEIRNRFPGRLLLSRDRFQKYQLSVKGQEHKIATVTSAKALIEVIKDVETLLLTLRMSRVGRMAIRTGHLTRIKHLRRDAVKASQYIVDTIIAPPPPPWWPASQAVFPDDAVKSDLEQRFNRELQAFLRSTETLQFKLSEAPLISIVIAVYNKPEFLYQCLRSIINWADVPCEVIIWDDASTENMGGLYQKLQGVKIIQSAENRNYVLVNNEAAKRATGEYLLLLNSDAQISKGTLSSSLELLEKHAEIGVVGGCLILPDGKVQEAGNVVWNDASCAGIGRGLQPDDHRLANASSVDYCSGAFFLTRRRLWNDAGGFDTDFAPAYYEETDFCLRLKRTGWLTVYNPGARIYHYEFATNGKSAATDRMMKNRNLLLTKHGDQLKEHHSPNEWKAYFQNGRHQGVTERCLFIDDEMPHATSGSGLPRAREILRYLGGPGREVSMLATRLTGVEFNTGRHSELKWLNELRFETAEEMKTFLLEELPGFDVVFVSRPHNKRFLDSVMQSAHFTTSHDFPVIVYDAEAIFAEREILKHKVLYGYEMPEAQQRALLEKEVELMKADLITAVSERDVRKISSFSSDVKALSINYATSRSPGLTGFNNRQGMLFVGPVFSDDSPNADGIYWMIDEVLPLLWKQQRIELRMAGHLSTRRIYEHLSSDLRHLGPVDDIDPLFDEARVFVCPIRFAAGTSLKALDAMSAGLPMVCTPIIAEQLTLEHGKHVLIADTPADYAEMILRLHQDEELWLSIRKNALDFIAEKYSTDVFRSSMELLLEAITALKITKKHV